MKDALVALSEEVEALREGMLAEREFRELGHRVVWGEDGRCNLPGMPVLTGEALRKQLARQEKFYRWR